MGLYGFKKQFVPFILDGSKTHTIRAMRVHPDTPGKMMHLYTGLRQPGAQLLMRAPCVKVDEIGITPSSGVISVNGSILSPDEADLLAWSDGFRYPDDPENPLVCLVLMLAFWRNNHGNEPFYGRMFHWDPKSPLTVQPDRANVLEANK